jgi:hypothetical protein
MQFQPPVEVRAAALTTALPGATRSGSSRLSTRRTSPEPLSAPRVGPRELMVVTTSSLRPGVALTLAAPSVRANGQWPGDAIAPWTGRPGIGHERCDGCAAVHAAASRPPTRRAVAGPF